MEPFQLFGIQHVLALLMVALVSLACYQLGASRYSGVANTLGGSLFALYAIWFWSVKLQDGMDWDLDLPLALCDLVFLFCLACFIRPVPILLTWITYWGLGGTLQALITPDVLTAFPSWEFCIFFVGHSLVVWAVFFLLGKNPHKDLAGLKGLRDSFLGLLGYTAVVGLIDALFGFNYGYLQHKPQGASVLDFLGDWPFYILGGLGIALVIFSVLSFALKALPPAASEVEIP